MNYSVSFSKKRDISWHIKRSCFCCSKLCSFWQFSWSEVNWNMRYVDIYSSDIYRYVDHLTIQQVIIVKCVVLFQTPVWDISRLSSKGPRQLYHYSIKCHFPKLVLQNQMCQRQICRVSHKSWMTFSRITNLSEVNYTRPFTTDSTEPVATIRTCSQVNYQQYIDEELRCQVVRWKSGKLILGQIDARKLLLL